MKGQAVANFLVAHRAKMENMKSLEVEIFGGWEHRAHQTWHSLPARANTYSEDYTLEVVL